MQKGGFVFGGTASQIKSGEQMQFWSRISRLNMRSILQLEKSAVLAPKKTAFRRKWKILGHQLKNKEKRFDNQRQKSKSPNLFNHFWAKDQNGRFSFV